MKERLLTGWTITRVIYIGLGIMVTMNGIQASHWLSIFFGIYFASMGLFSFGCASGNCYTGYQRNNTDSASTTDTMEVEYEEVKQTR